MTNECCKNCKQRYLNVGLKMFITGYWEAALGTGPGGVQLYLSSGRCTGLGRLLCGYSGNRLWRCTDNSRSDMSAYPLFTMLPVILSTFLESESFIKLSCPTGMLYIETPCMPGAGYLTAVGSSEPSAHIPPRGKRAGRPDSKLVSP